jgi:NAD(P)H-nitrite reductase large subunit
MTLPIAPTPFLNKRVYFPVTHHIPGGLATPDILRQIASATEKYGGTIKIIGSSIAILGLGLVDSEKALVELGAQPESFTAKSVRDVAICPGKPHCPMAQQDVVSRGLALDGEFFGQPTPGKLRLGISGCPNCCTEIFIKDIGLFGTAQGFTLAVGGSAGRQAQPARIIALAVPEEEVASIVRSILEYYRQHGKEKERLGDTFNRSGWEPFIATVIPPKYRPKT